MFHEIVTNDRSVIAIGSLIYLGAFVYGIATLMLRQAYPKSIMLTLLLSGFIFQSLGLNLRGIQVKSCPLGNLFEISQFIAWSLVLVYFIVGTAFRLRLLGLFTAGLVSLLALVSWLIPGWDLPYPASTGINPWIELHASLAVFSYAIFAIVALVSLMFLIQQHGLKKKQFKGLYQYLPSVQTLDLVAKRLMATGVVALSVALFFGFIFWAISPERVPIAKLLPTIILWIGYSTVMILRIRKRLVTRRHAVASIALFVFAIISLWPVQSVRTKKAASSDIPASTGCNTDEATPNE